MFELSLSSATGTAPAPLAIAQVAPSGEFAATLADVTALAPVRAGDPAPFPSSLPIDPAPSPQPAPVARQASADTGNNLPLGSVVTAPAEEPDAPLSWLEPAIDRPVAPTFRQAKQLETPGRPPQPEPEPQQDSPTRESRPHPRAGTPIETPLTAGQPAGALATQQLIEPVQTLPESAVEQPTTVIVSAAGEPVVAKQGARLTEDASPKRRTGADAADASAPIARTASVDISTLAPTQTSLPDDKAAASHSDVTTTSTRPLAVEAGRKQFARRAPVAALPVPPTDPRESPRPAEGEPARDPVLETPRVGSGPAVAPPSVIVPVAIVAPQQAVTRPSQADRQAETAPHPVGLARQVVGALQARWPDAPTLAALPTATESNDAPGNSAPAAAVALDTPALPAVARQSALAHPIVPQPAGLSPLASLLSSTAASAPPSQPAQQAAPVASPTPVAQTLVTPLPLLALPALIGVPQPAAQAFATQIAALAARPLRDERDDRLSAAAPAPIAPTAHAPLSAAESIGSAGPLDTRHHDWTAALIDRIDAIQDVANARDTRIRLVPDALGKIDVALHRQGDTLHVQFTADLPATRTLLAEAQPRLAELAEARGMRLGQAGIGGDTANAGQNQRRQPAPTAPISNHPSAVAPDEASDADGRLA